MNLNLSDSQSSLIQANVFTKMSFIVFLKERDHMVPFVLPDILLFRFNLDL
jgi:hypothetical protein